VIFGLHWINRSHIQLEWMLTWRTLHWLRLLSSGL
jgi:hypothetical protein